MERMLREPILTAPSTHWRKARANRCSVIIDASQYFVAVKEAVLQAQSCIYFNGWDFDLHIKFEPGKKKDAYPNSLWSLIRWIEKNRPQVEVYLLKWDLGILFELGRGVVPLAAYEWFCGPKVHIRLDHAHPTDAAQHQKLVVIDDALAFCGGIDLTEGRWDTPAHLDDDPRRRDRNGKRYDPWHDVTTAVDGATARNLGDLARMRWKHVTGQTLKPIEGGGPVWPESVTPDFRDIDVAIARTVPAYDDIPSVGEIEALYVAAIRRARTYVYCESQYFASRRIADEIARTLAMAEGPEIIIVNPESANGFLEAAAMDAARARLLRMLREADTSDRFRIYTPVTDQRRPIYVHAKVLIVDDVFLRVGSSNLNNRSLGFDVECDLAIEAEEVHGRISAILYDLLAEHLSVRPDAVANTRHKNEGSLVRSIDNLRGGGKSLVPYVPDEPRETERLLVESELFDPERPTPLAKRLSSFVRLRADPFR